MKNYINKNKKLLYALLTGATISGGDISANYHEYEKEYHIQWSYNSHIYNYCVNQRHHPHRDDNCMIMNDYIIARAVAGRITNYKISQENELAQNKKDLANAQATVIDNFLTEFEINARKKILLEKQEAIEEELAAIPPIKTRMSDDEFFTVIKNIMTKAKITTDKDIERELNFMLKILKQADEAKIDKFFII